MYNYNYSEWLVDGKLVYRLNKDGVNHDEINVTQTSGRRHNESSKNIVGKMLAHILNEIDEYINQNFYEHATFRTDYWGIGQIDMETIRFLVHLCRPRGIEFGFYKTVTAIDDIDWTERTITAFEGNLFVFPVHTTRGMNFSLDEVWKIMGLS